VSVPTSDPTPADWIVRTAGVPDLDAIMSIESVVFANDAWSPNAMRAELGSGHTFYILAESAGEIVGYAGLLAPQRASQADIQTIAVSASARRRGLGRALLTTLVAEARERSARELFLEVRADNPHAQALYEQLGFEQIAVRPGYYQPDDVDANVMKLELK
jgi:ribosomal-protein-alanine acetyltransferase